MPKRVLWLLGVFALGLMAPAPAGAQSTVCSGGQYVVDTPAEAADIAGGYGNKDCDLVIKVSIAPAVAVFKITAKSLTIDPAPSATPVAILNAIDPAASDIIITTEDNIRLRNAQLKTIDQLTILCKGNGCTFESRESELIVSANLTFGGPGGTLTITSNGGADIQTTTTWAGKFLIVRSVTGGIVFKCSGESSSSSAQTGAQLRDLVTNQTCADRFAQGLTCRVDFVSQSSISGVCGGPDSLCGGGGVELHLVADGTIDIEGSPVLAQNTVVVISYHGILKAKGATITGQRTNMMINGDGTNAAVDITDATITFTDFVRILAKQCPNPITTACVAADNAVITAKATSSNPIINLDNTSADYAPNVRDTVAECSAVGKGPVVANKGDIRITAANGNGLVTLCDAELN